MSAIIQPSKQSVLQCVQSKILFQRNHITSSSRCISSATLTKSLIPASSSKRMPPKHELQFGRTFGDHMLTVEYADGKWGDPHIGQFEDLRISPAASCLHYGEIFAVCDVKYELLCVLADHRYFEILKADTFYCCCCMPNQMHNNDPHLNNY